MKTPDTDHMPVENPEAKLLVSGADVPRSAPAMEFSTDGYVTPACLASLRRFHPEVVLMHPEIPQNTGSVSRLCAALATHLHLIEPMTFTLTEKRIRRAGLDYWTAVSLGIHSSWEEFLSLRAGRRFVFVETGGTQTPSTFGFLPGDVLIFGGETRGTPADAMEKARAVGEVALVTVPMFNRRVRSINLANTVSIVLYQAVADVHRI